ncbi:hypothetical protein [Marinibactrum halimedae]|uniref:Uncharacterized protein n=1 Tax=Marinibactrum halimedae TaxID=1444977 RepID=A0AA37T359_9GAMM|nr:hypothetical protein [Marinibactrum halimedae]MCD9458727.1 hypothetical protein [Marinibactrum halimedae]GLS25284.1 hypothetical protein GCM10007877_09980 [Marinibactrum halimedae]
MVSDQSEFSLFNIPNGQFDALPTKKRLAASIQYLAKQSQINDIPVLWLVQGKGAASFSGALDQLLGSSGVKAMASHKREIDSSMAKLMSNMEFFFSNAEADIRDILRKCEELGMKLHGDHGFNNNPYCIKGQIRHGNIIAELQKAQRTNTEELGSGATGFAKTVADNSGVGVVLAAVGVATFWDALTSESAVDVFNKAMANDGVVAIAAAAGIYAVGKTLQKSVHVGMHLNALVKSNFGRGNDYWYESAQKLQSKFVD